MSHISSAIEYIHAQKILHRDLKPDNILVTEEGSASVCKVADFGIAKLLTAEAGRKYYTSTVIGTAIYMAPEILQVWSILQEKSVLLCNPYFHIRAKNMVERLIFGL